MLKNPKLKMLLWFTDVLVFTLIFFLLNYQKFNQLIPTDNYLYLFISYLIFRIIFSSYYNRINGLFRNSWILILRINFWSSLVNFLFVIITISFSDLWSISRMFILGFATILFISDLFYTLFIRSIILVFTKKNTKINNLKHVHIKSKFYISWLLPLALLLIFFYVCMAYVANGFFIYDLIHEKNFLILISSWGLVTLLTNRYKKPNTINHYYELAPYIKSSILTFLLITFFYYSLRIEPEAIKLIYGAGLFHSAFEIFIFYVYFFGESKKIKKWNKFKLIKSSEISEQKNLFIKSQREEKNGSYEKNHLNQSIKNLDISYKKQLINFIWSSISSEKISKKNVTILNTSNLSNINFLFDQSRELLINIHKINDFRRINEYLLTAYSKIKSGGILIGNFIPQEKVQTNLRSKMPHFLYLLIGPLHFLFYRVFPKISIIKNLYFIITNGQNRVISKSELFGRLSFCGYEKIDTIFIEDRLYFICRKKKTISNEKFPSYGPIVKLKRVGYRGTPLYIFKLRTMYPYSEFIQGDLYEKNYLDLSGKIKNDYRITSWGKIFRKYFIDEIPQIYNWLKGDLNIVGVRAISKQYFDLYPNDIQKNRIKFKPGLIPPYYADLPKSFEEIIESERIYLSHKEKSPFYTDLKYFCKAIINILIKGSRSK